MSVFVLSCGGGGTQTNKLKPVAEFKTTQSTARPQVFSLDASGSRATVGTLAKYSWKFGDEAGGAATDLDKPLTTHTYAAAGSYTVTLTVSDDKGVESEPVTQTVSVSSVNTLPPEAKISGPAQGTPNTPLTFDGSSSTPMGDIKNYEWSFGDPNAGTGNNVAGPTQTTAQHVFAQNGSYRVTLKVTDSLGQSHTAELLVAIGAPGPLAVCSWSPMPATQGAELTFDGQQSTAPGGATIKAWLWDFDDGSAQVPGKTAKHTYNVQATFHPKLQVIDTMNRVGESTCADVVVGAAAICSGDYTLATTNTGQNCAGSPADWADTQLKIVESAGGSIVGTEPAPGDAGIVTGADGGSTLTYAGTWTGSTFTMTGRYYQYQDDGFGGTAEIATDVTLKGTFTGCSKWKGTWTEKKTYMGFALCTLNYDIDSNKL